MSQSKQEKTNEGEKKFAQAGGHADAFVQVAAGKIMKKVSKNEFTFYGTTLQKHPTVKPFVPQYFGTEAKDGNNYVVMQDLTSSFKKPCILDVKIGLTSVGEDATPEKKEAMLKKDMETTTHTLGIRITAMKVFRTNKGEFVSFGKPWGKKVTKENMQQSLKEFFDNGQNIRHDLIPVYLSKLKPLLEYFNSQKELRFYSSSLLFLYDGMDNSADKAEVKMIDFAHVHEIKDGGKDNGYITGLKNLIGYLEKI